MMSENTIIFSEYNYFSYDRALRVLIQKPSGGRRKHKKFPFRLSICRSDGG